jgi:hypothetical protein
MQLWERMQAGELATPSLLPSPASRTLYTLTLSHPIPPAASIASERTTVPHTIQGHLSQEMVVLLFM